MGVWEALGFRDCPGVFRDMLLCRLKITSLKETALSEKSAGERFSRIALREGRSLRTWEMCGIKQPKRPSFG